MAIDNWVNLNDVYVPANGGSFNGDLGVKGTLTIDDKTGNNTTYDVANEITTLRDSVSQTNAAAIVLKAYPVGAVYISYDSTSPASLFGGTWTPITGRFPYFNAGTSTGGSNTHTLTEAEMPSHSHAAKSWHTVVQQYEGLASKPCVAWEDDLNDGYGAWSHSTGGGGSHNNMPAYQTLYAWRRTN